MDQNLPYAHLSDPQLDQEYQALLNGLTTNQLRFVVARLDSKSDAEAARMLGMDERTPIRWPEIDQIRRALDLAAMDGAVLALTMRRKVLPRAMAVKIAGLESADERVRQAAATELIEAELGKALQRAEVRAQLEVERISDDELISELKRALDAVAAQQTDSAA